MLPPLSDIVIPNFKKAMQPVCKIAFDNKTSIITMNQSIHAMQTLELSVRSIFNDSEFEPVIKELIPYLRTTDNDDNYEQLYNAARNYLIQAIEKEIADSIRKSTLIKALNRLHGHFIQTSESQYAYNPKTKPNPAAVYYPNPSYGKSLYNEMPFVKNTGLINYKTFISAIGDSVADTIATFLRHTQYHLLDIPKNNKYYFNSDNVFSASTLRHKIEFALGSNNTSLFLNNEKEHLDLDELRSTLIKINVLFLTLTSTEAYYPFADNLPDCKQLLSVEENVYELQRLLNALHAFNPKLKLILSVSPIPLSSSLYSHNEHIVCASSHIKATLRVVADIFTKQNPNSTYYFPAFDTVMYSTKNSFHEGMQHVSSEAAEKLANLFELMYLENEYTTEISEKLPI